MRHYPFRRNIRDLSNENARCGYDRVADAPWRRMMLTLGEIESACDASLPLDFSRHELEGDELQLRRTFFPFGFPTEIRTNSAEILAHLEEMWGAFEKRFDTEPARAEIRVVESDSRECPPAPRYRIERPLFVGMADRDNYCIADLSRSRTWITVSSTALRFKPYLRFFFLECTAGIHVCARYTTPIHGGCVVFEGRGVLLCGDSGAGKSTLSYACARAGWNYVSDDASFLLNYGTQRLVTGNCYQVRFRPTAAALFPEIAGLDTTPRAAGKPSIELPTAPMQHISRMQSTNVDFIVFLNRRAEGDPDLVPYRRDVARQYMRQLTISSDESRPLQYAAIERLLTAEVFELRYAELDWAIERLQRLVREGR
jgi:hypothetical protein